MIIVCLAFIIFQMRVACSIRWSFAVAASHWCKATYACFWICDWTREEWSQTKNLLICNKVAPHCSGMNAPQNFKPPIATLMRMTFSFPQDGWTVLHIACAKPSPAQNFVLVKPLLDAGADVEATTNVQKNIHLYTLPCICGRVRASVFAFIMFTITDASKEVKSTTLLDQKLARERLLSSVLGLMFMFFVHSRGTMKRV